MNVLIEVEPAAELLARMEIVAEDPESYGVTAADVENVARIGRNAVMMGFIDPAELTPAQAKLIREEMANLLEIAEDNAGRDPEAKRETSKFRRHARAFLREFGEG